VGDELTDSKQTSSQSNHPHNAGQGNTLPAVDSVEIRRLTVLEQDWAKKERLYLQEL
jgi:hypothetical protein